MLGKLMKYECKATGRTLLPLYAALLVFALINRLFLGINISGENINFMEGIPFAISILVYSCTMMAVFVVTFFIIIQRFYKNLLGDEGYLMHTLPVKAWQNVFSKMLIAVLWTVVSTAIAVLSAFILAFDAEMWGMIWQAMAETIQKFIAYAGADGYMLLLEVVLMLVISTFIGITQIYASIAIGHLASKRRVLASFGAFLLINCILGIVTSITGSGMEIDYFYEQRNRLNLWFAIAQNAIAFGVLFAITNVILTKRLNLE